MSQHSFSEQEKAILDFWRKDQIFSKTLAKNAPQGDFVFYDGPPFATGLPHYGHIIAGTIKDVIPRFKTMQGYRVARRWGWDCHGLPVENLVEKEKGFTSKKQIEEDIAGFNAACRTSVMRYCDEWKKIVERTGRWVDMEHDYRTMENKYIEVIWWIFKQLYHDDLIYEGYKSMHLCPRCETTLSNFEVTQGYKDVKDIGVTVKFSILPVGRQVFNFQFSINDQLSISKDDKVYLLAWTTTPWTLPGNMALAVGEDIEYAVVKIQNSKLKTYSIIARDRVEEVLKDEECEIVGNIKGSDLVGLEYEPLFDFSARQIEGDANKKNAFKVYAADFVSTEEGTGIVHIAPAFGEDDYRLSQEKRIPFLQHVNFDGTFKEYIEPWKGMKAREKDDEHKADIEIIKWLAHEGKLFTKEEITHSYPFCWRCDSPLINYAASSWLVKVSAIKEELLLANDKVNWVPNHLKKGRFGKWLEGACDWAISRSRFWGAPLPVWRCIKKDCAIVEVVGSVIELEEKLKIQNAKLKMKIKNAKISDLHRPYIDEVTFDCQKCGGQMHRIPEVFDCWFESGSMPYAS